MSEKYVGFLQVAEIASEAYLGAILVTKLSSVPVEFRVTLPVKPTAIQKSLYGESMVPYIGTELCGTQLLESITHDLEAVFVAPVYMLGVRPNSAAPVIFLQEEGATPALSPNDPQESSNGSTQKTWQLSNGQFRPVTLATAHNFAEDFDLTQPLIAELSQKFDLLEPFERINRAIEVLSQQDKRFAGES